MSRANAVIVGACLIAAALPAAAQRLHVNDAAYVAIAHCQGLINSDDLQLRMDPTGINRFMDLQGAGRTGDIIDRATHAKDVAARNAATASSDEKARLMAERDEPCRRWAHMGVRAPLAR